MAEDSSFIGVNMEHQQINELVYDRYDPYDELIYSIDPINSLAENITVTLEEDGSNISWVPKEDWACPYVKKSNRLRGRDNETYAQFRFNVSDQAGGVYLSDSFWVYVTPVNDEPSMENPPYFRFNEGEEVFIDMEATDPDLGWEQSLRFSTNLTDAVYEVTGVQLIFVDGYDFDTDKGIIRFPTDNELVGIIPLEARVRDVAQVPHSDYQATPYPVYSNFTLEISNVNTPPTAVMDSPISSMKYNTTGEIEFNASRSRDNDMIHGQTLNYTWLLDGEIIGYGSELKRIIGEEGKYNVTLNVTDGEYYSEEWRYIDVYRTIIPGEKFKQTDIDRGYENDEMEDPIVVYRSEKETSILKGGEYSLDLISIKGGLEGAKYKITATFQEELDFLYTQTKQDPILKVYFMKPSFEEDPPILNIETISNDNFQSPPNSHVYQVIEIDLRQEQIIRPIINEVNPQFRILSNDRGIELSLTVVEMDYMGVEPDFELFATARLKTTKEINEGTTIFYESWDTTGYNSKPPQTEPTKYIEPDDNKEDSNLGLIIAIIVAVLIILVVIVVVIMVIIKGSSASKEEEKEPVEERGMTIEEELGISSPQEPSAGLETGSITPGQVPNDGWKKGSG